jgi:hypothetical protein
MPCLNEAETLRTCIEKAQGSLRRLNIVGEVIVADNGSTDGSQQIASQMEARVVAVADKGYGNALMGASAPRTANTLSWVTRTIAMISETWTRSSKNCEGYDLMMGNRRGRFCDACALPPEPTHVEWAYNLVMSNGSNLTVTKCASASDYLAIENDDIEIICDLPLVL